MLNLNLILRYKTLTGCVLTIFFAACLPVCALADTYTCPEFITASSVNVVNVPDSWQIFKQPNKLKIISAGFYDGQPPDMANLKPYESKKIKNLTTLKWKFEGDYPNGKWLSCDYEGGIVTLAKELLSNISECTVTYKKMNIPNEQTVSISCK